ncbi:unnamed protein product, partial [Linum tenue]
SKVTRAVDVNVKYKDPKVPVEDRITDLGRMTLEEKIGQMSQIEVPVVTAEIMEKYYIGILLLSRRLVTGCAKHYIGDGSTVKDINENNAIIHMKDLMAILMPSYDLAIQKATNGLQGFVIRIDKITNPHCANYTYSVQAFISAGPDMDFRRCIHHSSLSALLICNPTSNHLVQTKTMRMETEAVIHADCLLELPFLQRLTRRWIQAHNLRSNEKANPEFLKANKDADFAIAVVGKRPYAETKGDNLNLTISHPSQDIITKQCASGINCIVILISGQHLVLGPFLPVMDALAIAFLPGSEGQGVADVLFGDYGFTGKLARTWFKRVDQLLMN